MVAIADSADDFGENSYQSFETIAIKASIERRSANRVVRALVRAGYLKIAGVSPFGTNNFSVVLDKLGNPPVKRARLGRPKNGDPETLVKTGDSESKTGDSESLTGDSESKIGDSPSPDPSLSFPTPPVVPALSEEEKEQANRKVDAIIAAGSNPKNYANRDKIPGARLGDV